jgi:hypothetical protein
VMDIHRDLFLWGWWRDRKLDRHLQGFIFTKE